MLAPTVRRSRIGLWNTSACRFCASAVGTAQRTAPACGRVRPWMRRSSVVLPAPFGPITAVVPSPPSVRSTGPRMVAPAAAHGGALEVEGEEAHHRPPRSVRDRRCARKLTESASAIST